MNLSFSRITKVEATQLEEPFSEEEMNQELSELNGDKAPGLDSFIVAFWHHC